MKAPLNPKQALALLRHLEGGLPLVSRPYQALAERINAEENQVLAQMHQWHEQGLFRRVGLVLNHRALGFTANAMLVLDIPDALIDEVGQRLGRAPGITLCYHGRDACLTGDTTCSAWFTVANAIKSRRTFRRCSKNTC